MERKFKLITEEIESFVNEVAIEPNNSTLGFAAYLTLESLLKGKRFSWANAVELNNTRVTNTIHEIRKAVEYEDIRNISVPTKYSHYDDYIANKNPESLARLKKLFDYVASKSIVQKRLEKINPDWLKLQNR